MALLGRNGAIHFVVLVLSVFGIQGKPSLSLNFPTPFQNFGNSRGQTDIKQFSGKRIKNDSIFMVYFYDQTVAIVELQPDKLLLGCELIEVYEPEDAFKALGELHQISRPVGITFDEMTKLMKQCEQVEEARTNGTKHGKNDGSSHSIVGRGILANNPFVLLSGIIPGTKWCGTGDIALNYYDLGAESDVDKCCRAHDLCPVKVRAFSKRYNLTNESLYTKSHCTCDEDLFYCLKDVNSPTANVMGTIYFNIVQIPCLEDTKNGARSFRQPKKAF